MYTSTVQSSPLSANAALPPPSSSNLLSPVGLFCIFSLRSLTTVPCSWLFFYASCLLSPMTLSGYSDGMLEIFEPGALNYLTFFRSIVLTLSVFRNPILTHLLHSGSLDSLLCVLIVSTPGLAFSLLMPHTLAAVSSFSSSRAFLLCTFYLLSFFARSLL